MTVPVQTPSEAIVARYVRLIEAGEDLPPARRIRRDYEPGGPGTDRARRLKGTLSEIRDDLQRGVLTAPVSDEAIGLYVAAYDQRDAAARHRIEYLRRKIHDRAGAPEVETTRTDDPTDRTEAAPTEPVHPVPEEGSGAPPADAAPVHRAPTQDAPAIGAGRTDGETGAPVHSVQGTPDTGALGAGVPAPHRTESAEGAARGALDVERTDGDGGAPVHSEVATVPAPIPVQSSSAPHTPESEDSPVPDTADGEIGRQRANGTAIRARLEEARDVEVAQEGENEPAPPAPMAGAAEVERDEVETIRADVEADRTEVAPTAPVRPVQDEDRTGAPVAGAAPVHRAPAQGAPVAGAGRTDGETGAPGAPVRVRPGVLTIVLWAVGAAVAAAAVTRAVQTPVGARVWEWLTGVVGADAAMMAGVAAGAGVLAATVGLTVHLLARFRAVRAQVERTPSAWSSRMYLVAAVVFMGLSVDTSIRFFREKVGITEWWELTLVFSGMELGLLACAVAMYEAVRRDGKAPHSARMTAWGIATLAGTTGLLLGGWPGGLIRAAGPFLAMVMLHMALGIERQRTQRRDVSTAVGRVLSELQERALSWVGLSDEGRSAVVRSRQRAARRAARLALQERDEENTRAQQKRDRELQRELAKADVARDAEARRVFLHEVEVLRSMRSTDALVEAVRQLDAAS